MRNGFSILLLLVATFSSFTVTGQIMKEAEAFLSDSLFRSPHVGIAIYEPATQKYWYRYQSDKYFIPASNTKLFSLYAGLKILGDSLPAARYYLNGGKIALYPTADPTFLHPDFKQQPLFDFLLANPNFIIVNNNWQTKALGYGWAWDDYNDDYMAERSLLPLYGNVTNVLWKKDSLVFSPGSYQLFPGYSEIPADQVSKYIGKTRSTLPKDFQVKRMRDENVFNILPSTVAFSRQTIPLRTDEFSVSKLLADTLKLNIGNENLFSLYRNYDPGFSLKLLRSRPSDSMFRPMMQQSDNFFAEQTLLMAANEKLGIFNEHKLIDTLLKYELKDIPQKPQWVDGSGLSRYNLFTPEDFVYILKKMIDEFGVGRLKGILATGGQGTIRNYYKNDSGFIYAKTGTLSNNLAFSGFFYTKQNKLLIFSLMVNAYPGGATPIRRKIEAFLSALRTNY